MLARNPSSPSRRILHLNSVASLFSSYLGISDRYEEQTSFSMRLSETQGFGSWGTKLSPKSAPTFSKRTVFKMTCREWRAEWRKILPSGTFLDMMRNQDATHSIQNDSSLNPTPADAFQLVYLSFSNQLSTKAILSLKRDSWVFHENVLLGN